MMKEISQMILVLTAICAICGTALSGIRKWTAPLAEHQRLINVQGPKVQLVLNGSENDLIEEREQIETESGEVTVFVGKKQGQPWALAFEAPGKGFGGDLSVMVGFDLTSQTLTGIQVISHQETPGIGSKAEEAPFTSRFNGLPIDTDFRTKMDGGKIDGISGATYSSRGVCEAVRHSIDMYPNIKSKVVGP